MRSSITPKIVDAWTVVDKWWKPEEKIKRDYVAVDWGGHELIFVRQEPEKIWRLHGRSK